MDINKLKTFVDLAHTLSFSATAANLYVEQSTVSKHIHTLEKELGASLFDRNNRHVHLSNYGKTILPWAQQIVELNSKIVEKAQNVQAGQNNTIDIGVIPTFADYPAFQKIMAYQKKHSSVHVKLHEMETSTLLDQLDKGIIDLAFARSLKAKAGNYDQLVIDQEDFAVALPTDDPLSDRKTIQLTDLRHQKFIMLAKNSLLYNPVIALCHKSGFDPQIVFTSDRMSTILKMVGNHQGIAVLMHHPGQQNDIIFKKMDPTRTSYLMFLRQKQIHSKNINQLWHYLQHAKQ